MKNRFFPLKLTFLFFTIISAQMFGQQTEIDINLQADYNNAVKLFNSKAYAAAQKSFIEVSESVQEQVATANETGVDIVMSRAEFLAKFANTSAWETVVENVRTSPDFS